MRPSRTGSRSTKSWLAAAMLALLPVPALAKGIVELQEHRREESITTPEGAVRLVNLNPAVNAWYLLEVAKAGGGHATYNLENAHPQEQRLHLSDKAPGGVVVRDYLGNRSCDLWGRSTALKQAAASHEPFAALCEGRVYLRNQVTGNRSVKEMAVDFLRDHVWGGEAITTFVKDRFFRDKYKIDSQDLAASEAPGEPASGDAGPPAAAVSPDAKALMPAQLDIRLVDGPKVLEPGRWYPVRSQPGIFVSAISASRVAAEVMSSFPNSVARLDSVEASATAYLVAFDMNRFGVGFSLGTDHPRVEWSERAPLSCHEGLPGPDGFSSVQPLVKSGVLNPAFRPSVVATFAGGFKRHHGAFKWGELSKINHGSHYGFIEDGVVFSRLQPGLSTLYVRADGGFGMKTWSAADAELGQELRFARQNGVPIIERLGPGSGRPGAYVSNWAFGNWSGSAERKERTLRSGLCLQRDGQQRYLIYGYFSTATPNAMARIFQAYGCEYAMHLDMNAPEHTYMALYHGQKRGMGVEHLVRAMADYDARDGDKVIPRFVAKPDNRDFVFLYKKQEL